MPPSPWLDGRPPNAPSLNLDIRNEQVRVQWAHTDTEDVNRWIVYYRRGARWHYELLNRATREIKFPLVALGADQRDSDAPKVLREIAVSALDRLGNESPKNRRTIENRPE